MYLSLLQPSTPIKKLTDLPAGSILPGQ